MSSILPEDEQDELPSGFSIVGHIGKFLRLLSRGDLIDPGCKRI